LVTREKLDDQIGVCGGNQLEGMVGRGRWERVEAGIASCEMAYENVVGVTCRIDVGE